MLPQPIPENQPQPTYAVRVTPSEFLLLHGGQTLPSVFMQQSHPVLIGSRVRAQHYPSLLPNHNRGGSATHPGHIPEALSSGDQGGLAPLGPTRYLIRKATLSRPGVAADTSNA